MKNAPLDKDRAREYEKHMRAQVEWEMVLEKLDESKQLGKATLEQAKDNFQQGEVIQRSQHSQLELVQEINQQGEDCKLLGKENVQLSRDNAHDIKELAHAIADLKSAIATSSGECWNLHNCNHYTTYCRSLHISNGNLSFISIYNSA